MGISMIDPLSQILNLIITMQVLYQVILAAHKSKPRVSEMNLSKSTARLQQKLPCQAVRGLSSQTTNETKPPSNFKLY